MHNLTELKIWNKAIELSVTVYKATISFPKEDKYGLTSQIRRSAVSIPSNIAEGAGRNSESQFVYFLSIANGSAYELQTQLIISHELNYIDKLKLNAMLNELNEIQKMNYSFQKKLKINIPEKINKRNVKKIISKSLTDDEIDI